MTPFHSLTIEKITTHCLLLIATAIAILCMGTKGQMVGFWDGCVAYAIALGFCCGLIIKLLILTFEAFRLLQEIRSYPHIELQKLSARIINTDDIFIAQVGFLHPELVATQGLLSVLDAPHLQAVLLHEQAHYYYRDTFWFFWLGWLRSCTNWLPNTDIIHSELIALRELRADRWAANHVDSLLLAESLLQVARAPVKYLYLTLNPTYACYVN
ncbi:M56 family metallopeptidase [Aetokthonos hydrillicola Thurmond2011]|jgi:Zn-dependent protease with chaperone function|uniref:M56 family metallopeptidase n=1 Tax=Aetokthonos hydrillicola Thurmond2011 TaxID=2712845 RepID=A0AAP5I246_9CYAN|nr:M56 family metallopeptidase [Aetokthonos hydrillicola]MBO3457427.1 M56 family metallopeptidase [Aetokthonos hydrillicola CCALA 1050]MBW4586051.1 M56 family metallopeptidase [Aetokthonos hydrillicola CCALA 1050]MDR9893723.1 M56 family metallopeptidase [Aetokthonos hydrillicola Thurmond2011]